MGRKKVPIIEIMAKYNIGKGRDKVWTPNMDPIWTPLMDPSYGPLLWTPLCPPPAPENGSTFTVKVLRNYS